MDNFLNYTIILKGSTKLNENFQRGCRVGVIEKIPSMREV